jgi:hypothetical protein
MATAMLVLNSARALRVPSLIEGVMSVGRLSLNSFYNVRHRGRLVPIRGGLTTHWTGARVSNSLIVELAMAGLNARPVNSGVRPLR